MLNRNKYGYFNSWKAAQEAKNVTDFKEKMRFATAPTTKEVEVSKDHIPLIEIQIEGRMPPLMTHSILTGTVIPLVQDECVGMAGPLTLKYLGKNTFGSVKCLTFQGWCPIHKRQHDSAKFQLQKNSKGECWWKCFRDGSNKWIPFGVDTF